MQRNALAGVSVLIVEDEVLLQRQIRSYLESLGADVTCVDTLAGARQMLQDLSFDFALLDVNLPDGRSTDLLKQKEIPAATGAVVMTAEGGVAGAVEAMKLGSLDYLVKPFDPAELTVVMGRARRAKQAARLDEQKKTDVAQTREQFFFGQSLAPLEAQLQKILAADNRLESRLPPVLIQGETGTGKTTIARWLHHQGPRAHQPLVEVNCSALPETLAESELFGHERGAFTDARSSRMGLLEAASGGTLFLDELPSLSLALQSKLLTAIEDHRVRRVGGNREIGIDVRIVAATNRDLQTAVREGQFREDLYHRLDLFRVAIPPLRDRGEDLLRLADRLLADLVRRHRLPGRSIHPDGRRRLMAYHWPGNVRELAHELERSLVFEESDQLRFDQLSRASGSQAAPASDSTDWFNESFVYPPEGGFSLEDAINRMIHHALRQTNHNVSATARLLGVSRDYIRYRLSGPKASPADVRE